MERVFFEAGLELKDEQLRVTYRVENRSPHPVYLVDHLYRELRSGKRIPDEKLFYVIFDPETGKLELVKQLLPIPGGLLVEPAIPYVHPLPPSEVRMQEAILSLPLQENYPYRRSSQGAPQRKGVSKTVQVIIGCVPHFEGLKLRELVVSDAHVFRISYLELKERQELLESPVFHMAIPVMY
jgi:hypothetical protein